jgi:hypothetical protein
MSRPWEIPGTALLDGRWNACLDAASAVRVSPAEAAAAWVAYGPDRAMAVLREMAAGGEVGAGAA